MGCYPKKGEKGEIVKKATFCNYRIVGNGHVCTCGVLGADLGNEGEAYLSFSFYETE